MVTYNRPHYTRRTLPHLLETCDQSMRVWLWHNGTDEETLEIVKAAASHPRVHRFHHSVENRRLMTPLNWLWKNAQGSYFSKVDDDCLLPAGWAQSLREVLEDVPELGILGAWRFQEEDFVPELAEKKIQTFSSGHRILQSCFVQGSGFLMKRACYEELGGLRESFTKYCARVHLKGWIIGFLYPFVHEDHMDDTRSPNTGLRTDEDLMAYAPIGAIKDNVTTLEQWTERVRWNARFVQEAPLDGAYFYNWRDRLRRAVRCAQELLPYYRHLNEAPPPK